MGVKKYFFLSDFVLLAQGKFNGASGYPTVMVLLGTKASVEDWKKGGERHISFFTVME